MNHSEPRPISRRLLLQGGLALGATGALSACGTSAGGATSSASTAASTAAASTAAASSAAAGTTAAETAAAAGGKSIGFFGWDIADTTAGLGKGFQACKEAWEKQTGNSLTFDGVPFDNFVSSGVTKARAGQLSDTVELLPDLNHAGIFPALQATKKADYPDIADQLTGWESGIMDLAKPDEFAGVPGGAQGTLFYYNKKIFKDAGLDPESPPKTWAEFTGACDKIKALGKTPLGMSGVDGNLLWWAWISFSPQFFPTSEDVLKVRSGEVKLTDDRFVQMLTPIASTFKAGYWNEDYASKKFADIESQFAAGEIGIVPGLITSAMNWKVWDDKMGPDAYGVFTAPLVDGGSKQGQFFNPVLLYGLSTSAKDPETSRSWTSFLVSKEGQELLLTNSGAFPNRADIDVAKLSGSKGAAAISAIVKEVGGVNTAQNQFNSAVLGAATQNITSAAVNDDVAGFLANLQKLQES